MLITLGWPLTSWVLSLPEIVLILSFHLVLQKSASARFSEGLWLVPSTDHVPELGWTT